MTVNEILEIILLKTLWIWLPFRAFGRMVKEIWEKYNK